MRAVTIREEEGHLEIGDRVMAIDRIHCGRMGIVVNHIEGNPEYTTENRAWILFENLDPPKRWIWESSLLKVVSEH